MAGSLAKEGELFLSLEAFCRAHQWPTSVRHHTHKTKPFFFVLKVSRTVLYSNMPQTVHWVKHQRPLRRIRLFAGSLRHNIDSLIVGKGTHACLFVAGDAMA